MNIPPNDARDDCMYVNYDEYDRSYDSDDIQSLIERSVCYLLNFSYFPAYIAVHFMRLAPIIYY